jgi:integrase
LHKNIEFLSKKDSCNLSELEQLYKSHPDRVNLSKHTHRADHNAIKYFIASIGDISLSTITPKHIIKFKTDCQSRGLTPQGINTYLRHLQSAFNFAIKDGLMQTAPQIPKLKEPTKIIRVIPPDDLQKILDYSKEHESEMHRIIIFALYTGCRREEIVKLRYEDIKDGCIKICSCAQMSSLLGCNKLSSNFFPSLTIRDNCIMTKI